MCHGHWHSKGGCGRKHKQHHGSWGDYSRRHAAGWFHPPVNLREFDDRYELHVAAPGRNKEDFRLTVKDNVLTIAARKREGEEGADWKRQEFRLAPFERSFQLTDKIDPEGITASYQDGILVVALPKRPGADTPDQEIFIA